MTSAPSDIARLAHAAAAAAAGPAAAALAAIHVADTALAAASADPGVGPKLKALACHRGCAWCCHQVVGVTPAEAALLAQAFAELPRGDQDRIRNRTQDVARRGQGLDQRGWWAAKLPCPLLGDDGGCVLHPVRPLPCRAYTSADDGLCRRSLEGEAVRIPVLAAQWTIYGQAQAGLSAALAAAGVDPGPVSLVDALAWVLG